MLPWSDIETVLLDLDGTVIDLAFDNFLWGDLLPEYAAKALGACEAEIAREIELASSDRPPLTYYSVEHWSQHFATDVVALHRELQHFVFYRKGSLEFLRQVRNRVNRVVVVSNGHPSAIAVKNSALNFSSLVDVVFSAFDLGTPKQDYAFWARLREIEPFQPDRTLFVDDTPAVLKAARNFGIGHVFAIDQPDTTQPPVATTHKPSIRYLSELVDPVDD